MPRAHILSTSPRAGNINSTAIRTRSEEHTSELQSQSNLVCRLLLEKKTHIDPKTPPLHCSHGPQPDPPSCYQTASRHADSHRTGRPYGYRPGSQPAQDSTIARPELS